VLLFRKMAKTIDNIRFIIYDLKYSWYFRIWAVVWFICLVMTFTTLIILSNRATMERTEKDNRLRVRSVPILYFPRFHIRVASHASLGVTITGKYCVHGNAHVFTADCQPLVEGGPAPLKSVCFAVNSDTIFATNAPHNFQDRRIDCFVNTTLDDTGNSGLLAWGLEKAGNTYVENHHLYSDEYVAPNNNSDIYVTNYMFRTSGPTPEVRSHWRSYLVYQSSVAVQGSYKINTILDSFVVRDVAQVNTYSGYRAIGDMGGFAFFMIILHTVLMILAGLFLSNNSKFLGAE